MSCTPDTVQRTRLVAVVDELLEDPNNERKTLRNIEGDGRIGQNPRRSRRRAPGANLILALNSDPSVCRLGKGDDRPVDLAAARLALPTALWCVGPVAWSDRDTLLRLTLVRRPEVLVKGGDWPVDQIAGARGAHAWGGQLHSIQSRFNRSTTRLLSRIRHP